MLNELTGGDPDAYFNQRCAFLVDGPMDVDALEWAFGRLVARHEILRSVQDGGTWKVLDRVVTATTHRSARGATAEARLADACARAAEIANEPFDLSRAPLMRLGVVHVEADRTGIVVVLHHIAGDWVALDIACRELSEHYRARITGQPPAVPELHTQYWDFAHWQRKIADTRHVDEQLAYWDRKLADAEMYLLPSAIDQDDGDAEWECYGRTQVFEVTAREVAAIRSIAAAHDATLFMALLAATQTTIAEITGARRVAVAAFAANRMAPEVQDLIGIFPNIQILCTEVDPQEAYEASLLRARTTCIEAQSNSDVPFHSLLEIPCFARWMNRQDQHWVLFYVRETAPWGLTLPGLVVSNWVEEIHSDAYPPIPGTRDPETGRPYLHLGPVDLDISFAPSAAGFGCRLSYNVSVFDAPSIEAFGARLAAVITRIAGSADPAA